MSSRELTILRESIRWLTIRSIRSVPYDTDSKETRVQLQTRPGQRQCWDPSRKLFYLLHLYNRAINKQFQRRLTCSRRETPTSRNCTSVSLPFLLSSAPSPAWPDDVLIHCGSQLRWLGYVGFGAPPCGNRKWY